MSAVEYRVIGGVSSLRTDQEAQRVGEYLERRFRDGPIDPERVVTMAAPARSPLHRYFEWDDTKAAAQHRLTQARGLLRSIAVVRVNASGEERKTRAYHNVSLLRETGVERAYVNERTVWSTPELADQVVVRAHRELLGWQDRYAFYDELRGAVEHVDAAVETLAERV